MKSFFFIVKYLRYYLSASTKHSIHSPFVYQLTTEVINAEKDSDIFKSIEAIRRHLLSDPTEINITDLGAGSSFSKKNKKKLKDIVRHSSKPAKYAQLLFRIVDHFKPHTILELGSAAGLSTLYLASASSNASVITIEGNDELATIAKQNTEKLQLKNVDVISGSFEEHLAPSIKKLQTLDLVFIDGNHRKEPTLQYFETCLLSSHNNTILVFDDIHWSDEMEEAWDAIKKHPQVMISIDLFFMGLVFLRKEQTKEHFVVRF